MDTTHRTEADKLIGKISLLAGGASLVPTPILQGGAMVFLGYKLVKDLSEHYSIPFEDYKMGVGIGALVVSIVTQVVSEGLEAVMEGNQSLQALGNMISAPIINSFIYLTVGNVIRDHFEAGGTLSSLDTTNTLNLLSQQMTMDNIRNNINRSTNRDYSSLVSTFL